MAVESVNGQTGVVKLLGLTEPAGELPSSVVNDSTIGAHLQVFDPCDAVYGAVNDALEFGGASMVEGSKILKAGTGPFTEANVKQPNGEMKWAVIAEAGLEYKVLFARIVKYISATEVELETAASKTTGSVLAAFGTDNTTALEACWKAMEEIYLQTGHGSPVMQPRPGPGHGFFYRGTGFAMHEPYIKAVSRQAVTFYMPPTTSLVVSPKEGGEPKQFSSMDIRCRTFGGYGVVRHSLTGPNSGLTDFLIDAEIFYPAGCGISSLTSDNPYWKITAHVVGTRRTGWAVALAGYTDACVLDIDMYGLSRGIKLGRGSDSCVVRGTWTGAAEYEGVPVTPLWFVPNVEAINSGRGPSSRTSGSGARNTTKMTTRFYSPMRTRAKGPTSQTIRRSSQKASAGSAASPSTPACLRAQAKHRVDR
jgi:hypothetical protein